MAAPPGAFDPGFEALTGQVLDAAREQALWLERIRAGLAALLAFLDDDPLWARVFVLEAQLGGALTEECVARVGDAIPEVLEESRTGLILGVQLRPPTELIAELVVLAVLSVIRRRMLASGRGSLADLEAGLMRFVVEPYLARGAEDADLRGTPAARHGGRVAEQVPFRPHPRILMTLQAIEDRPQASSSEIAEMVWDEDERHGVAGLFRPLEQGGLIEDVSASRAIGRPRAWLLTPYGRRVLELMRTGPALRSREPVEPTRVPA